VRWCAPTLIWAVLGAIGLNGMARVSRSLVISGRSWASVMVACLPAAYVEKTSGYREFYSTFCTAFGFTALLKNTYNSTQYSPRKGKIQAQRELVNEDDSDNDDNDNDEADGDKDNDYDNCNDDGVSTSGFSNGSSGKQTNSAERWKTMMTLLKQNQQ